MSAAATNRDMPDHLSVTDLRFPRQLLLWAMRQVRYGAGDNETQRLIGEVLQRVGISPAHQYLNSMADRFAMHSTCSLQVLPPDRGWVSCDELLILDALGAMQQGDTERLEICWMRWLSATAFRVAVVHAAELMSVFSGAGLLLGVPSNDLNNLPKRTQEITLHEF